MAWRIPFCAHTATALILLAGVAGSVGAQTDEPSRADTLLIEANRLIDSGDLSAGAHRATDALAIYEVLPADSVPAVLGCADANYLIGKAFHLAHKDDGALQYWARAIDYYQKLTGRHPKENLLAVLEEAFSPLLDAGRVDDALKVAAAIPALLAELGRSATDQARWRSNLGVLLKRAGRLREAERELERAVNLSQEGKSPPTVQANYLYFLGLVQNSLDEPTSALRNFFDALALLEPLPGSDLKRAEIMLDVANALKMEGKREEARQQLEGALRIISNEQDAPLLKAKLLVNLANDTYDRPGRKKEAVDSYREALRLVAGREGAEEFEVVAVANIANYLFETGATEEAIGMYRQALAKENRSQGAYSSSVLHKNFGLLLLQAGRLAEAQRNLLDALRSDWSWLADNLPTLTRTEMQLAIDKRMALLAPIYASAFANPGDGSVAYEATLLMKAVFSEANRVGHLSLRSSATAATSAEYERYLELRREISRRVLQPNPSKDDAEEKTRLALEMQQLELELRRNPDVFQGVARMTAATLTDVKAQLRPGEVLLDYVTYQDVDFATLNLKTKRYGVFVVDGTTGKVAAVDLGEQGSIDKVVAAYREGQSAQADPITGKLDENELAGLGEAVRSRMLDSGLKGIAAPKRIYVAPDGVVGLIPFEALPIGRSAGNWHYLVEGTEIVYLLTGRDLTRLRAPAVESGKEVWLVGDPAYEATPDQRLAALSVPPATALAPTAMPKRAGAAPIAGTRSSSVDVTQQVPADWIRLEGTRSILAAAANATRDAGLSTRILLETSASEEKIYAIHNPRVLLFATHGFYMPSPPPIQMTIRDNTINADLIEAADPLQRSMLILAGANHRDHSIVRFAVGDRLVSEAEAKQRHITAEQMDSARRELGDGLLTAYEVLGMDLVGTEIVQLVACESGLGTTPDGQGSPGLRQAQGESVAGLRQAFIIAGAQSLVMSLWPVPLDDTAAQMQSFLGGWLSRELPRYQAFRASQLAALGRARRLRGNGHPFWWAGFVYLGNPGDR